MKNNQISLRFNEEEFKALQKKALADGRTASAYAKEVILNNLGIVSTEKDLTLNEVHEKAQKFDSKKAFAIRDLFTDDEWGSFSKASRLSVGRLFFNSTKENGQYHDYYRFVDKKSSNLAYYVKL
ncbi:single-stranded DNA-binding protein [Macrococcoides caseolyticum]|nr:single-stranded DNA-binding protein [Macrococcus caseolyticus]